MRIVQTETLTPGKLALEGETVKLHIYNGLDCCVTLEVFEAIEPQLTQLGRAKYEFSKALQGPVLEIKLRGILVDEESRLKAIKAYQIDVDFLDANLKRILSEGLGLTGLNWRSPAQLKTLFYDQLKLPAVRKRNSKGQLAPTVNRDALEKLAQYFDAQPIINHILALRDIYKKIGVLKTEIDSDMRMRTSVNIAGTNTGRLSSSFSDFGTGGNLQNIEERLRSVFVSDPGMKFAYVDLEQAESRLVGALCWNKFHASKYLDACESGDLHTYVCKMTNPQLKWTGNLTQDRDIAEQPYYRQHSFRHMAKVLGHGSSYMGQPNTMEKHTKIPALIIAEFQGKFFAAFPEITQWHAWVKNEIREVGKLTSLMGRERQFFGRRDDPTTVREAVAFDPQGSVADILNTGMLQVWRANVCQLLLQIHDAILIQYPEEKEDEILPLVLDLIKVPVELSYGRTLLIPADCKVGFNWANQSKDKLTGKIINPLGLKKYKRGTDDSRRSRISAA